ncbi:transporter substrate-binding domain-containing protein [Nitrincola nitratireducens]|uniref:histidine kinase n=1 Tax=Nitrincola nitratireducens TaxID=1229521 RepID=W9UWA9_9GAMM|nr:transporter substrate-binding domain-containing protein [Nitrincola nitratireducens]EXJ11334.1 Sensor protein ZraS [Nitrincola nitratireducens]
MTPYFFRFVALFVSLFVASIAQADRPILVGGDLNYPPYEFLNEQGEPDGYNTELTLAIAEVMGMDVNIQLGSWDDMRSLLEQGKLDVLQGMAYSTGRTDKYDFSPAHALVHQSIFARKGTAKVNNLNELAGKEIIVQRAGVMHDFFINSGIDAKLILVDTHAAALRLLASGQYDYALVANLPGLYLGKELELSNITPVGRPFGANQYGYAVMKGNTDLLAQFSEGLAILKNTGRHQKIYDKWLGPLEQDGFPWKEVGLITGSISGILLVILGGIVVWNRMLTREVSRRTDELKQQQKQLMQADKMASLGILVSGVAHEINNPSSLLLLNLPVIQEFYSDAEEILEAHFQAHGDFYIAGLEYSRMRDEIPSMLQDMLTGAQKIRRIVNDLKDFARETPDDLKEPVDLNEILEVAIRLVDNTIRQSCNQFKVEYTQPLPYFYGSAQKIEQVIINLIVNACQALETSNQAINVRTFLKDEHHLCLEVWDQGKGIAPAHMARLCDPFFTTRREEGGTGLGLFISSKIVQEHGGSLVYESSSQGTKAILTFSVA